jgi:pSer/pThr/pTyr-binding forkhead associated (FHA) protein
VSITPPAPEAPQKAQRIVPTPTLRFSGGQVSGLAIRLTEDDGTLGRREDNAYVVADPQVSRVSTRSSRSASAAVLVTDLGSSGGTRVNGDELVRTARGHHGDVISFGGVEARFEDPASAAANEQATMVFELPKVETGPSLSPRQQQVLEGIAEGMTNKEIGERARHHRAHRQGLRPGGLREARRPQPRRGRGRGRPPGHALTHPARPARGPVVRPPPPAPSHDAAPLPLGSGAPSCAAVTSRSATARGHRGCSPAVARVGPVGGRRWRPSPGWRRSASVPRRRPRAGRQRRSPDGAASVSC